MGLKSCVFNQILMVSYEVPLYYGVINKQMLLDQRDSSTVSDESFLRESQSVWTGNNADAWLDSKRLNKRRTLLKCERKAQENPSNPDTFYIIGVKHLPRLLVIIGQ